MHIHQVGMPRPHYTPGNANRIRMTGRWAVDGQYAEKIVRIANAIRATSG